MKIEMEKWHVKNINWDVEKVRTEFDNAIRSAGVALSVTDYSSQNVPCIEAMPSGLYVYIPADAYRTHLQTMSEIYGGPIVEDEDERLDWTEEEIAKFVAPRLGAIGDWELERVGLVDREPTATQIEVINL